MTRIERQILKRKQEIKALRDKQRLEQKGKKAKVAKKTGRPPISKAKLQQAKLLALDNPLTWVSFKLEIGIRTLYRYGISRENLNKEIEMSLEK